MKQNILLFIFTILSYTAWAGEPISKQEDLDDIISFVKQKYVPDTREGIYDITATLNKDTIILSGSTTCKSAIEDLANKIKQSEYKVIINSLKHLPNQELRDTLFGIVNVSVADIRTQNRFTSGMATQTLMGTPVKLFDHQSWYRIQLPDTYFGWAHEKQIVTMNKEQFNDWLIAPKVIYTRHYGFAYQSPDDESSTVSDLVAGCILKYEGISGNYFKVSYPDKRIAYIHRNESDEYSLWLKASRNVTAQDFIETAKTMMGIPYVWGGNSTKGFDCSGLVSTVMNLHGLWILRDASQQANIGEVIDISKGYDNLRVGDLMFFGVKDKNDNKEDIRHVGFYLGNNKFIHASGYVKVSSLDPQDKDYDELNTKEFIKATRIIDGIELKGVNLKKDNPFYQIQK